jgi:hypothetical protein
MEVVRRWLLRQAPHLADRIMPHLSRLPGRDPGSGKPVAQPIEAAEWSIRDGDSTLRFAWNVDWNRQRTADILAFLDEFSVVPAALRARLDANPLGHYQIGLAGERAKLYAYDSEWCPPGVRFVAFDLLSKPGPAPIKSYREHPGQASAAALLSSLGKPRLLEVLQAHPQHLGSGAQGWVTTERVVDGQTRDVSLHLCIDNAIARLPELAGEELAERAGVDFRAAHRLSLRWTPSYLSFLDGPGPLVRTLYYRLRSR